MRAPSAFDQRNRSQGNSVNDVGDEVREDILTLLFTSDLERPQGKML